MCCTPQKYVLSPLGEVVYVPLAVAVDSIPASRHICHFPGVGVAGYTLLILPLGKSLARQNSIPVQISSHHNC